MIIGRGSKMKTAIGALRYTLHYAISLFSLTHEHQYVAASTIWRTFDPCIHENER